MDATSIIQQARSYPFSNLRAGDVFIHAYSPDKSVYMKVEGSDLDEACAVNLETGIVVHVEQNLSIRKVTFCNLGPEV